MRGSFQFLLYLWAGPTTLLGLLIGSLCLLGGGGYQRRDGVLEFWGRGVRRFFALGLVPISAMALGHVILGRSSTVLDSLRAHELVHVQQAERWGPLFLPAYLLASLLAVFSGGHYYHDNRFEVEAVRISGIG